MRATLLIAALFFFVGCGQQVEVDVAAEQLKVMDADRAQPSLLQALYEGILEEPWGHGFTVPIGKDQVCHWTALLKRPLLLLQPEPIERLRKMRSHVHLPALSILSVRDTALT